MLFFSWCQSTYRSPVSWVHHLKGSQHTIYTLACYHTHTPPLMENWTSLIKAHTPFPKSNGSFSIHTPQPALRYCIISSSRKGPWNLRSPTSRILTILSSWDAIFPRRVHGQWADPGADWCGSYHLITHIRIPCNVTEISGWECGWCYSLVPRPPTEWKGLVPRLVTVLQIHSDPFSAELLCLSKQEHIFAGTTDITANNGSW